MRAQIDCHFHNFDLNSLKEMEILGTPEDRSTSEILRRLGTIITYIGFKKHQRPSHPPLVLHLTPCSLKKLQKPCSWALEGPALFPEDWGAKTACFSKPSSASLLSTSDPVNLELSKVPQMEELIFMVTYQPMTAVVFLAFLPRQRYTMKGKNMGSGTRKLGKGLGSAF